MSAEIWAKPRPSRLATPRGVGPAFPITGGFSLEPSCLRHCDGASSPILVLHALRTSCIGSDARARTDNRTSCVGSDARARTDNRTSCVGSDTRARTDNRKSCVGSDTRARTDNRKSGVKTDGGVHRHMNNFLAKVWMKSSCMQKLQDICSSRKQDTLKKSSFAQ